MGNMPKRQQPEPPQRVTGEYMYVTTGLPLTGSIQIANVGRSPGYAYVQIFSHVRSEWGR